MSKRLFLESNLDELVGRGFPYQLPAWFNKIIAQWTWRLMFVVIIAQPWIGWGYWDDAHTSGKALNFFFYLSFLITFIEILLQAMAIPELRLLKKRGWDLVYYSAFFNLIYGIDHVSATEQSIGPLFGIVTLSAIFFYFMFQVRPFFKTKD